MPKLGYLIIEKIVKSVRFCQVHSKTFFPAIGYLYSCLTLVQKLTSLHKRAEDSEEPYELDHIHGLNKMNLRYVEYLKDFINSLYVTIEKVVDDLKTNFSKMGATKDELVVVS